LTRCATIDQALLEKTKVDKVLARLVKRGDDDGKKFAQKILDSAAELSKQKAAGAKSVKPEPTNGATTKIQKERSPTSESKDIKIEMSNARKASIAVKKASDSATTAKATIANKARQPTAKADAKAPTKTTVADAAKTKANTVTAKPSGFFSSLKSASKKPGTSSKLEDGKSR
jgi:hypothetical protein